MKDKKAFMSRDIIYYFNMSDKTDFCGKIIDVDNRYLKVKDVTGLIVYVSKNNIVSITLA